jgi:hypothetical protein
VHLNVQIYQIHHWYQLYKIISHERASVILVLLAVVAMATSCGRKNNCPAYGTTSIDKPAYKGRN